MNKMKYNVDYHNLNTKTVDTQSLSRWHKQYLNGMSAQAWCEYGAQLNEEWSNPKVIRRNAFKNNHD